MSKKHFIVSISLLLLLSASLNSCFPTRDPEPPGQSSDWQVPLEPSQLIENLKTATIKLNQANYQRCWVEDVFQFKPDPEVAALNPGLFNSKWGNEEERTYFANLSAELTGKPGASLNLSNLKTINFNADSLEMVYDYRLTYDHNKTNLEAKTFTGQVRWVLIRIDGQEWRIKSWEDFNTETNQSPLCWSHLKIAFFGS